MAKSSTQTIRVDLTDLSGTNPASGDHILKVSYANDQSGNNIITSLRMQLFDGVTEISAFNTVVSNISSATFATLSVTVSTQLTNYNNIDVLLTAICDSSCANGQGVTNIQVGWVVLETPNEDSTAPSLSTSTLNLDGDSPTLVLTFDESVVEATFDPTKITITDSAGANGVTLAAASPNESANGITMTIPITISEKETIAAHSTIRQLDILANTWTDIAINANAQIDNDPLDTQNEDSTAPLIATSTLNLDGDSPTLVLTFDETVDFSTFTSSAITITDSGGLNGQALSGNPTEGIDGTTMTIPITLAEKEVIAAHSTVRQIDATNSAWDDVAANANLAVTDDPLNAENEDTTAPLITDATLNLNCDTPTLLLTFNE